MHRSKILTFSFSAGQNIISGMNIGLDVDGCISEAPEFFAVLSHAFRAAGHRVYVISFRDQCGQKDTEAELSMWGISHDGLFLAPRNETQSMWKWKAEIAERLKIDVMIDDSPNVLNAMPLPVVRLLVC
jgi:hypothetical protein